MLQTRQQFPPSSNVEEIFAELITAMKGQDGARCLAIASFTMLVYEYFLTFDDEVTTT